MKREHWILLLLVVFAILTLFVSPFLGMESVSLRQVISPGIESKIFWNLRVPRSVLAFLAGACLAMGGLAFQALFRNSLATPYTLGVASGASLGAGLFVRFGVVFSFLGLDGLPLSAFIGACVAMAMVYGLAKLASERGFSSFTLLLAGVAMNYFFSSLLLMTQYLSDFTKSFQILRWTMGGLETVGYQSIYQMLPFIIPGMGLLLGLSRELDLLLHGEAMAIARGVDVEKVRRRIFLGTSLSVGGVVAFCGPIGFVGLMAPHICRLMLGPGHARLIPASILFGASFLCWCDTLARSLIAPAEIPVGVITALLGGPFFLWLLVKKRT